MIYAFRCRNCNSLEPAVLAGEREVPVKCPTCGAGVTWEIDAGGNPIKTEQPENWEVLADITPERAAELNDYHGEIAIERHVPFYNVRNPDGSHVLNDDGSFATLPLDVAPPDGLIASDTDHVPASIEVEATEDAQSKDKPGAVAARGGRS